MIYPSDHYSLTYRHLEQASRLIFISVHMMFFWLVLQVSPSLLLKIKFTKQFTLLFTESFSKIFFKKIDQFFHIAGIHFNLMSLGNQSVLLSRSYFLSSNLVADTVDTKFASWGKIAC